MWILRQHTCRLFICSLITAYRKTSRERERSGLCCLQIWHVLYRCSNGEEKYSGRTSFLSHYTCSCSFLHPWFNYKTHIPNWLGEQFPEPSRLPALSVCPRELPAASSLCQLTRAQAEASDLERQLYQSSHILWASPDPRPPTLNTLHWFTHAHSWSTHNLWWSRAFWVAINPDPLAIVSLIITHFSGPWDNLPETWVLK